jgi:alkylation response protein AidB-like acyl-CoA dehydrogenase
MKSEAITAAHELSTLITRLRNDTESSRRIAQPIVERLRDLRLCRMTLTRQLQGLELPPAEALEVYEALAGAEASVAWIVWNNSLPCIFGRFLESAARSELFADPRWLYANSTRPTGRAAIDGDGYRVNGQWALVSGCELAEWIGLMCLVEVNGELRMVEPGQPEMRVVFLRRSECEILDTWHSGGLRGTGSHDVVVKDKRVPRRLTFSPGDPSRLDAPIGRIPIVCTMAAGYGAQTLGIAQSSIDTLLGLTKTKVNSVPGPGLAERPAVLASIARQTAAVEAARLYLRSCLARLWDAVSSGAPPAMEDITAVWAAAHHAVDQGRTTVDTMYAAGGASSLYTSCPLERAHRDIHAMSRHMIAQAFWLEDAGRVKVGTSPMHPLYAF